MIALRTLFVNLIVALGAMGIVAFVILRDAERTVFRSALAWALAALGLGVVGLILVLRMDARVKPSDDPERVVSGYRSFFMIGIALGVVPALVAFVGALLTQQAWVYLVGLVVALAIFARVSPTNGGLVRWDRKLAQAGSGHSLREALTKTTRESAPPKPARETKRVSAWRRLGIAVMTFFGVFIAVNFALSIIATLLRPIGLAPPPGAYAYIGPLVVALGLAIAWRLSKVPK